MQRLHNGYAKSIEQMTGRYLQSQRSDNKSSSTNEQLSFQEVLHEEKGIGESLVLVDDLAFIVNVKNNTVITAMDDSSEGIFTNIDGAVIG